MPTISVCMPVCNGARFLPRALYSLRDQGFRDFEVVVVDDGSTDGSADEAERLLALYDLTGRVIRTPNRGSARARDTACVAARAPIIATLDCDDWWAPDYLADMLAVLHAHREIDLVYCDLLEEFPDGREILKSDVAKWIELPRVPCEGDVYRFTRGEFFAMLLCGQVLFPSCTMYTKTLYEHCGGYAATLPHLTTSLDWDFGLRASRLATVAFLKRPLLRKYARADSVSHASFIRTGTSSIRVLQAVLEDSTLRPEERRNARRRGAVISAACAYDFWATHKSSTQAMKWVFKSLRFKWNWSAVGIGIKAMIPRVWINRMRSGESGSSRMSGRR